MPPKRLSPQFTYDVRYAEPGAQLSAARVCAIYRVLYFLTPAPALGHNVTELFRDFYQLVFLVELLPPFSFASAQASSKKFLDTLEEVLLSGGTSPVVRERLLDVLAAAAFTHPGNGKEGYRVLWRKVKPPHKPDEVCDVRV